MGASSDLSLSDPPVSPSAILGGDDSRGRLNGGSKSSGRSGEACLVILGDCGGVRFIETRRSPEGDAETISLGGVCGLLFLGEIRLSVNAAEGGSEYDAELRGERSPPPEPSEEAARECEVGAF